jgi:hypothetical protein
MACNSSIRCQSVSTAGATWMGGRSAQSVLFALMFTLACSSEAFQKERAAAPAKSTTDTRSIVTAEGADQFPDDGLADWVSYADTVVVATVKSERQLPFSPDVEENKEGYVGRIVEVVVDEVLWLSSSSSAKLAQNDTKEMLVFGWLLKDERLIPMSSTNAPRLEVGGQYILPLVEYNELGWAPLTAASVSAVSTSPVATNDATERNANKHEKELNGRTSREIAALLATVSPNELAKSHSNLPPEERIQAVLRLQNPNPPDQPPNTVPVPKAP